MGLQRLGHDWATVLNWMFVFPCYSLNLSHPLLPPHVHINLYSLDSVSTTARVMGHQNSQGLFLFLQPHSKNTLEFFAFDHSLLRGALGLYHEDTCCLTICHDQGVISILQDGPPKSPTLDIHLYSHLSLCATVLPCFEKHIQPLWRTVWRFLKKLEIELPYDPAIPLLGIHTEKTRIERDMCTPMFITALFTIARTWKQPRCPSADEWIRKQWYIYTVEYYSAIKRIHLHQF